jgi:hypothetical protein
MDEAYDSPWTDADGKRRLRSEDKAAALARLKLDDQKIEWPTVVMMRFIARTGWRGGSVSE